MNRPRTESIGWLIRYFVFWGFPFILAFSTLAQSQSTGKPSVQSAELRFDGVYASAREKAYSLLRFYNDGTVVGDHYRLPSHHRSSQSIYSGVGNSDRDLVRVHDRRQMQ